MTVQVFGYAPSDFHKESNKLQKQYQTIQTRIKRARELFLDAQVSKEEYDEMMTGLQVERHNVEVRLQRLTEADDGFNKSLSTIFALASKAHDLFKSSELEEKRRIITILFPNLEMSADKLVFKPRKPFDVFLNLPHRPNWLPLMDDLRTFFMVPSSEIIKYFGWGNKTQNMGIY
jgi:site-specific DNA recombinase